MDAITRYATIMNERNPEMNITVFDDNVHYNAQFKKKELSRQEEFTFPKNTKKLKLSYEGTGCVLTEVNYQTIFTN